MSAARKLDHPEGDTDDWFTPLYLFDQIPTAGITVDAAGHPGAPVSQRIGRWWGIEENGLIQPWSGERVWVNPPYSNIAPWVRRAHEQMRSGCLEVLMLLPANRTALPWWQEFVEPYRDGLEVDGVQLRVKFVAKRHRFGFPGDLSGKSGSSPTFGLVLLRWRV